MTVVFILWLREVKKYLRSRVQIVASLGAPLMYLGVLGFGLGPVFRRAGEGSYLQFMAPGVIGMTVLFTAMFSGIAMLWDRQFGFQRKRWSRRCRAGRRCPAGSRRLVRGCGRVAVLEDRSVVGRNDLL